MEAQAAPSRTTTSGRRVRRTASDLVNESAAATTKGSATRQPERGSANTGHPRRRATASTNSGGPQPSPATKRPRPDGHVDGAAWADQGREGTELGPPDQQPPARELDGGLLGGLHARLIGRVGREYLDDGVGAVARGDLDAADDVDVGSDGFGGVENGHGGALLMVWWGDPGRWAGR